MEEQDKILLKNLIEKYSFSDIVTELLMTNMICPNDILDIADEYSCPDNVENLLDTLLDDYNINDILQCFDDKDLLDYLSGSFTLDDYVQEQIDEVINEMNEESEKSLNDDIDDNSTNIDEIIITLSNAELCPDDIHKLLCLLTNNNFYIKDGNVIINKLKDIVQKNNYNVNYK